MNSFQKNSFINQIQCLKDNEFQEFIDKLFVICYATDFIPIKQKRDKGCDGILNRDTILCVYSPEKYDKKRFEKKIGEDYKLYETNFKDSYPKWEVIYNGIFTTDNIEFILGLNNGTILVSRDHIVDIIQKQNSYKRLEIAKLLDIPDELVYYDTINEIVCDIIQIQEVQNIEDITYEPPVYISDKIRLNFSQEESSKILDEYANYLTYFSLIKKVISEYRETDQLAFKNRINSEFRKFDGDFSTKMNNLIEVFSKNKNNDLYRLFVRVLVIYIFEQCLIGEKTRWEENASST